MKRIYDYKIILALIVVVGACIYGERYYAFLALSMTLLLHFLYTLFYTRHPKQYWVLLYSGLVIGIFNIFYVLPQIVQIYCLVGFIESIRVSIMAILKYPKTIKDLQVLTEDLESRVKQRTVELHLANQQLQRANEQLKQLDEMKTAFVSQASHDLRTPLTAIKGSLDNLTLGIAGELNEKQKKILARASRSVDRLTNLINDILDLSRIEQGRLKVEKSNIVLTPIIHSALNEAQSAADLKKISLTYHPNDTSDYPVYADPQKIERILSELIGNAIKYTPECGKIDIESRMNGEDVEIAIHDTGIGMNEEECVKVWERFYRTDRSQFMAKGSGLGLSIVKELISLHNGSIHVQSEPDNGSTFTVRFPLRERNRVAV
ncbi:MAG: sensor histidine kinase [bacterium]|jgi:signal transduction histidine kinase